MAARSARAPTPGAGTPKEPVGAIAGDRASLALCLRRATALAQPRAATLRALRIELYLDAILFIVTGLGGLIALELQALPGLAQRLAAAVPGA